MSIVNSSTARQTRPVKQANQFTNLSSEICKDGGGNTDVDCRVRKAKGAFAILSPIWRNSSFPNSLIVRIFKSNILSVLLYGSSIWKVTKSITTKLQVFVNRSEPRQKHFSHLLAQYNIISLARTPEIGQGLGRILSCGARKPEQTYRDLRLLWTPNHHPFSWHINTSLELSAG